MPSSAARPYQHSRTRLLAYRLLALPAALLMRLYWMTCRIQVLGEQNLPPASTPIIPCYWHQRQAFCLYYLLRRLRRRHKMAFLISPSKIGALASYTIAHLGGTPIRGSGRRTGAQAIRRLTRAISEDGFSTAMTPDGSKGPIFEFKQGPVLLAQLTGAPLVPISYAARRFWQLKSWDKLMFPKPFTKVVIAIGPPRPIERGTKLRDAAPVQQEMQAALDEVGAQAAAALG